jgi:hypothetical protein
MAGKSAGRECVMNYTLVGFLGLVAGIVSVQPFHRHVIQEMVIGGCLAGRSLTEP